MEISQNILKGGKIMKVSKKFRFDAGHRLMLHEGACHNLHGHTYEGEVIVEGELDKETGMVIDFKDLKKALKPLVSWLDHAFIANQDDKEIIDLCSKNDWKLVIMRKEPTAENIADFIVGYMVTELQYNERIKTVEVILWETPDSKAIAKGVLR